MEFRKNSIHQDAFSHLMMYRKSRLCNLRVNFSMKSFILFVSELLQVSDIRNIQIFKQINTNGCVDICSYREFKYIGQILLNNKIITFSLQSNAWERNLLNVRPLNEINFDFKVSENLFMYLANNNDNNKMY